VGSSPTPGVAERPTTSGVSHIRGPSWASQRALRAEQPDLLIAFAGDNEEAPDAAGCRAQACSRAVGTELNTRAGVQRTSVAHIALS
jgi:hypothetical protein